MDSLIGTVFNLNFVMSMIEINHHDFTKVECPHCHILYLLQGGGQKSGSSPAVHIEPGSD